MRGQYNSSGQAPCASRVRARRGKRDERREESMRRWSCRSRSRGRLRDGENGRFDPLHFDDLFLDRDTGGLLIQNGRGKKGGLGPACRYIRIYGVASSLSTQATALQSLERRSLRSLSPRDEPPYASRSSSRLLYDRSRSSSPRGLRDDADPDGAEEWYRSRSRSERPQRSSLSRSRREEPRSRSLSRSRSRSSRLRLESPPSSRRLRSRSRSSRSESRRLGDARREACLEEVDVDGGGGEADGRRKDEVESR